MLSRFALLAALLAAKMLIDALAPGGGGTGPSAALAFGFVLLAADLLGTVFATLHLPRISGYLVAGLVLGPSALDLVVREDVDQIKLIDQIALTFIALSAGLELDLSALRARLRSIACLIGIGGGFALVATAAFAWLAWPLLASSCDIRDVGPRLAVAAALLLGVEALGLSPPAVIAVIRETRAKGPEAETILGATVLMDVVEILLFAVAAGLAAAWITPGQSVDAALIAGAALELIVSLAAGFAIAWGLSLLIRRSKLHLPLVLLVVAFLVARFSADVEHLIRDHFGLGLELEPLLVCVAAGFALRNVFGGAEAAGRAIDRVSLAVYVLFFAVTGADLDLHGVGRVWLPALLLVAVRAAALWAGCRLAGRVAGDPPRFRNTSGLGMITQAGVSMAIVLDVAHRFPTWGEDLRPLAMAAIAVNLLIGPIALRFALNRRGIPAQAVGKEEAP
ncbi:MAG: cation:proton antiporter [Planctomycetes bacterium]|nr:cation:proton antiporter [Planctomycetota bacterium]